MTRNAIFIAGCARSGTTMLGSLLGSYDGCLMTPESQFKTDILQKFRGVPDANRFSDAKRKVENSFRFKLWGIDLPRDPGWIENFENYADFLFGIVDEYGKANAQSTWSCWIDHTPKNRLFVSELLSLFPESMFIHVVRDARAVATSLKSVTWGPSSADGAADFWLQSIAPGLAAELRYPDRVVRVRYEDLLRDPAETLRTLCRSVGLSHRKSVPQPHVSVPNYTKGQHQLVGTCPDASKIDEWQNRLTSREIEIIEAVAGSALQCLGYDLRYGCSARTPTLLERSLGGEMRLSTTRTVNLVRQALKMAKYKYFL